MPSVMHKALQEELQQNWYDLARNIFVEKKAVIRFH